MKTATKRKGTSKYSTQRANAVVDYRNALADWKYYNVIGDLDVAEKYAQKADNLAHLYGLTSRRLA